MIIGINGKIGSGKDTVGRIIQYLTSESGNSNSSRHRTYEEFLKRGGGSNLRNFDQHYVSDWEIKKFAGKLKTIASLLTGIPIEKFEDQEFKKQEMSEEWWYKNVYDAGWDKQWTKESVDYPTNTSTESHIVKTTYRQFLQNLGTEAMRDGLHTNVWVNALFADYKRALDLVKSEDTKYNLKVEEVGEYPNWILTDMRFPNEMEAVVEKGGITIRVVRNNNTKYSDEKVKAILKDMGYVDLSDGVWEELATNEGFTWFETFKLWTWDETDNNNESLHPSETALDDAYFDHVISNDGTIEDLVEKVREILIKETII